jgi:hypothetical protein
MSASLTLIFDAAKAKASDKFTHLLNETNRPSGIFFWGEIKKRRRKKINFGFLSQLFCVSGY